MHKRELPFLFWLSWFPGAPGGCYCKFHKTAVTISHLHIALYLSTRPCSALEYCYCSLLFTFIHEGKTLHVYLYWLADLGSLSAAVWMLYWEHSPNPPVHCRKVTTIEKNPWGWVRVSCVTYICHCLFDWQLFWAKNTKLIRLLNLVLQASSCKQNSEIQQHITIEKFQEHSIQKVSDLGEEDWTVSSVVSPQN